MKAPLQLLVSSLLAVHWTCSLIAEDAIEFGTGRPRPPINEVPVLGTGLSMSKGSFRGVPVGELPKWTLSLWFQPQSNDGGNLFGVVIAEGSGEGYQLSVENQFLWLRKVGGGEKRQWANKGPKVQADKWQQVVITCSHEDGPALYLNGKLAMQGRRGGMGYSVLFDDYFVGSGNWGKKMSAPGFDGLIDDFALYDRMLSPEEIGQLFGGGKFPEDLVAFNDFENVSHRDLAVFTESDRDEAYLDEGRKLYELHCISCHSKDGVTPPLNPLSRFFSKHPMENGGDPFSMFQTVTYGFRNMMPALQVTPEERYKVIHYIREKLVKVHAPELYVAIEDGYTDAMPRNPESSRQESIRLENLAKSGYLRDYGRALISPVERPISREDSSVNALTIDLGNETTISYDLGAMRSAGAWTGGFLDFSNTLHHKLRAPGLPTAHYKDLPGTTDWRWAWDGRAENPVPDLGKRTTWPEDQVEYRGHYPYGDEITISYRVRGRGVLESPLAESVDGTTVIHHRLSIEPGENPLEVVALSGHGSRPVLSEKMAEIVAGNNRLRAWLHTGAPGVQWRISKSDELVLSLPAAGEPVHLDVAIASGGSDSLAPSNQVIDLSARTKGGPRRWTETHTMKGKPAVSSFQGYAMDSVPVPLKNAYNSWMRTASLAFFPDGRLAVGTLAGDVWIVSGADTDLGSVTWTRFAAGLYEPLGMKVVDGVLTAITRGRIVKLHDLNADGEADYYEAFFNETEPDKGWHAYSFDLEVGDDGSYYYARTGGFSDWSVPGGIVRVSADGQSSEVVGVGMRVPNGIGRLADGRITFGDNQGTFVPASKIAITHEGAFHGAGKWDQREGHFDPKAIVPPIVYMPQELDSSSGGQLWVGEDERFGPLGGRLFHTSFGRARTMYVMIDEPENGLPQGAVFSIPIQMESGTMRVAKSPVDGQLYFSGLTGWQAGGGQEGSIQRLRYTGADGLYLLDAKARKGRLELTFNHPIDTSKTDPTEWMGEAWNYRWSKNYGSPHFKVSAPDVQGTDLWKITHVQKEDDGRKLILNVPDLRPCNTLKLPFTVQSADGLSLDGPVFFTIHELPE